MQNLKLSVRKFHAKFILVFITFLGLMFLPILFSATIINAQNTSINTYNNSYQPANTNTQNERILDFNTDIDILNDGKIKVEEKIEFLSKNNEIKRGIFRELPLTRKLSTGDFKVQYEINSITKNGIPEKYETSEIDGVLNIKIGDANTLLNPGKYLYTISYTANNQIGSFKNYDELYWNVTGNYWKFPIDKASATIKTPSEITQISCYTGTLNSTSQDCFKVKSDKMANFSTKQSLPTSQGLTVAVGFKKGAVATPKSRIEPLIILILNILTLGGTSLYCYLKWQKHGKDNVKPVVYPQFNPPYNLPPASMNYLIGGDSNKIFSSSIVSLATKGFIRIQEEESGFALLGKNKSYILQKLREADQSLHPIEQKLLNAVFNYGNTLKIDGKYNAQIESLNKDLEGWLHEEYNKILNAGNNFKYIKPAFILLCIVAILNFLLLSVFSLNEVLSMPIIIIVIFTTLTLLWSGSVGKVPHIKTAIGSSLFLAICLTIFSIAFIFVTQNTLLKLSFPIFASNIIILSIFAILIKRPTPVLLQTQSLIEGFKMYLESAEKPVIQQFNPPKFTPQVFEYFLPYAMTFSMSKIWGDKMTNLIQQGIVPPSYQPYWYAGATGFGFNDFNNNFSSKFEQTVAQTSTPPSSGSSSSGSGGRGFSGGGGGGGGGSGW